jgi:hypothetical protein
MPRDIGDPRSWPDATIVVRGGVNLPDEIRRTTVRQVHDAGGWLIATRESDEPPNHCNLFGLTAEELDSILSEPEINPVPNEKRWRGTPT